MTPRKNFQYGTFDSNITHFKPRTAASRAINEVHSYLEENVISRKKEPLNWWRTNIQNFKNCSRKTLCSWFFFTMLKGLLKRWTSV